MDTFTLLPLEVDPSTKAVICKTDPSSALEAELTQLNALHRSIVGLDTPNSVPPPPLPVNPKRSAQVAKLRESGNTSLRKGAFAEAIKLYSLGIEMAMARPAWEPSGLVREELSGLYANRAQAHMAMQAWPEGAIDAECSVELKKGGNAKAWWRRAKCLAEMSRYEEAKEWIVKALEFESGEQDLVALQKEVDAALEKRAQ